MNSRTRRAMVEMLEKLDHVANGAALSDDDRLFQKLQLSIAIKELMKALESDETITETGCGQDE